MGFAALKEVEELSSEEANIKSDKTNVIVQDQGNKDDDKIKQRSDVKEVRNKSKSKKSPELNTSMGIKLDNLCLNDEENDKVVVKRQTRSRSRRNLRSSHLNLYVF